LAIRVVQPIGDHADYLPSNFSSESSNSVGSVNPLTELDSSHTMTNPSEPFQEMINTMGSNFFPNNPTALSTELLNAVPDLYTELLNVIISDLSTELLNEIIFDLNTVLFNEIIFDLNTVLFNEIISDLNTELLNEIISDLSTELLNAGKAPDVLHN